MTIGVLPQLNKWTAGIAFGKAPEWQRRMLRANYWFIHLWFLKLCSLPDEGKMITPANYRGFRLFKQFNLSNGR